MNSERRKIFSKLRKLGWRIKHGGKHYKLYSPGSRKPVICSASPSCPHALKNLQRDLKKRGVHV